MAGNLLFEAQGSSWVTAYIYFAGALHAQYKNNTTYFVHRDHLGSTRLLTGLTNPSLPVDNLDYLPFGEQIAGDTGTTHKFTGQERDAETGLDYFLARHMAPGLGRFLQPDPGNLGASAGFPQTWNGYGYVANNPMANTDPYGLFCPATGCVPSPVPDPCLSDSFEPSCHPCPEFLCFPTSPGPRMMPEPQTPAKMENPKEPPQTSGRCLGGAKGLGFGGLAGASAGIGAGPNGAWGMSGVASKGGGTFVSFQNGLTKTDGTFSSAGLPLTNTGGLGNYPSNNGAIWNKIWGGFVGAGAGFFVTNAGNSASLRGPFTSSPGLKSGFGFRSA